ncbi:MAG: CoA ester lyase [Deltaproteobacteria bacterium]|nr:CoA ester lyase [Deltaproteobacteria bacterium]MBW2111701.1 CoA ester lyase [Deltaproteobacteria bacterium]MBW2354319.1 CoA ester lyase [Deltaproteobacteria bacterium]
MIELGPLRTALFVPGNRPDRVDKAVKTGADAVIIDLEDAVPLSEKEASRAKVRNKILEHAERKIIVRVNSLDSPFFQGDLAEVITGSLACLMVPKVENGAHIREINENLLKVEKEMGMEEGAVSIIPLIESAGAVQNVFQIATEKTEPARIYCVAFGAADYTLDMGIEITKEGSELLYPRSTIAVASRAAGIEPPLDTPFMMDLKDMEALKVDAYRAKQLGFQGKLCIHPNQIEPCHLIFSPAKEEILYAERVVRVFEDAEKGGSAAILLDGKFIDYPVVERARQILKVAKLI